MTRGMRCTMWAVTALTLVASLTLLGVSAGAQEYPTKSINFIIPFGAGGSADVEGRLIARAVSEVLGQRVIPINKPGGGGAITYTYVKNAAPDGYILAWNSTSVLTTTNLGNVPFRYSAMDYVARTHFIDQPLVVRADAPWRTLEDFVADAKRNPGKLKIGNSGTGSSTHVTAVAIATDTGIDVIHVPLGIKRRNAALLGGEVDAITAPLTGVVSIVKGGKARLLALPSEERNPVFPNVPTMKELGYPTVFTLFRGISAPKDTPKAVLAKLEGAVRKAVQDPDFVRLAKQKGFRISFLGRRDFERFLIENDRFVREILKKAGLK